MLSDHPQAAPNAVHVLDSQYTERQLIIIHNGVGSILLTNWYRPPCHSETTSIDTLSDEITRHRDGNIGTIVVGDLNVHNRKWLKFSQSNSLEGVSCRQYVLNWVYSETDAK